jgi:hypothetical protein
VIESEKFHRGLADRFHRVETNTMEQKVAAPAVIVRMKKPEELRRLSDADFPSSVAAELQSGNASEMTNDIFSTN